MRVIYSLIICLICFALTSPDKTGDVRGIIRDSQDGVPYATVTLLNDSSVIATTVTDIDGHYSFKSIAPGTYNIKASSVGFQPRLLKNITVTADKITFADMSLKKGVELKTVEIEEYVIPLIDKGNPATQKTVTYEDIRSAPVRDLNSISSQSAGAYHTDKGKELNIRGSRSDGTAYYVDGIKVRGGNSNPPIENNEEYDQVIENKFFDAVRNPLSTFSIDVDAASYSNIRRFITQGSLPAKDAVRIEEMVNYFNYNYPQPTGSDPFSISTEISTCPWNTKHRLIQIGLNGKEIATENLPDNNLVFLIDVSGSMNQPNKLPLLKKSFHLLVDQLRKQDRVAIVVYAGNAGLVLPSTKGNDKEKILSAIDALEAGGSTAGGAGIQLAYSVAKENFLKGGNNRVILATDGDFNVGVSSDEELTALIEGKRDEGIFLTVLGFGTGNYKDSKMEKLADKGNGNFAYVDNILEANKVFVKEMGATLNTIAKDVKLQIEFNPAKVKAYRLVGYENRVLEDKDFNDDKKDAGELGSGRTVTALYEIIPAGSDELINNIDSLRYQKNNVVNSTGNELMTVKFRYKDPNGTVSKLIVHPLVDNQTELSNTSIDFRFASSVAEFGMLLRDSKFKGTADFKNVLALAHESKGNDVEGYHAEFIRLVETAEILFKETARENK
jgi:Ca-activated chloride channel family protein